MPNKDELTPKLHLWLGAMHESLVARGVYGKALGSGTLYESLEGRLSRERMMP